MMQIWFQKVLKSAISAPLQKVGDIQVLALKFTNVYLVGAHFFIEIIKLSFDNKGLSQIEYKIIFRPNLCGYKILQFIN